MFKKFFNALILLPLALVIIAIAVANRHIVRLVLDPLSPDAPLFALEAPFFVYLFAAMLVGVLLGGIGMWFGQRKWRRAAQLRSREAHEWRREAERLGKEATSRTGMTANQPDALPSP